MKPETLKRFLAFAARIPELPPCTQLTAGPIDPAWEDDDYQDDDDESPIQSSPIDEPAEQG